METQTPPGSGEASSSSNGCFEDRAPFLRYHQLLRLEERQIERVCSRPLVALDLVWSIAFVLVACSVLLATARERPSTPIRVWILGYAIHCLVHACFVCYEYRRRPRTSSSGRDRWDDVEAGDRDEEEEGREESWQSRFMQKLESTNAVISLFWWMLGLYWIVVGGKTLLQDAPRLYWLTVVFLAFDVFFAIFCVILACIIGIALCCCLPCIFAFVYSLKGQEGATQADIDSLRRSTFKFYGPPSNPIDPDCCICLSRYEEGAELCYLPCDHRFHSGCIVKWLRISATCPLCKDSILRQHRNDDRA